MSERNTRLGMFTRSLEAFASSCGWFRGQLKQRGLTLRGHSALARGLDNLEAFRRDVVTDDRFRFDSTEEAYDFGAEVYGADFLTKVIHWGHSRGLCLERSRYAAAVKTESARA
jgi:hypothetical protein